MFEIEKIKIDKRDSPETAIRVLIKNQGRFTRIGSGCYADVYGNKKSNVVYKVGEVDSNAPYLAYVKALRVSRDANPYLPKIHGIRIYSNGCKYDDHFVVAMEKLTPLPRKLHSMPYFFERLLGDDGRDSDDYASAVALGIISNHMQHAIKLLHRAYKSERDSSFDIHSGNFMLRGEQIVITDPLC